MAELGEKIRSLRRRLGLTLDGVATTAGISKPFLSQVERGHATPSMTSLMGIAKSMGVAVQYFVDIPSEEKNVRRARNARFFTFGDSADMYSSVSCPLLDCQLEALLTRIPPGRTSTEVTTHAGEEFIYVLEGELLICVETESFRLVAGDSAHYKSTKSHSWLNPATTDAVLLWVGTPRLL
ncbi:cupin domain-containing protein [Paraburkholderia sediminicola]|uniref:helix-turn-helix domain-containing protein n=1 Tax=Paraburkholderia sediminicola TaxID=458836 RepID=UPI0038BA109E